MKETAEAHGGTVRLESQRSGGSTFTLELPLDSRQREQELPDSHPPGQS